MKLIGGLILLFIFGAIFYILDNFFHDIKNEKNIKDKLLTAAWSLIIVFILFSLSKCVVENV